jgi:hypothetical protein
MTMTFEEADDELGTCTSMEVMPKLIDLVQDSQIGRKTFLHLMRDHWPRCDRISELNDEIIMAIEWAAELHSSVETEHLPLLMTEEERRALAALPEVLTIYRGLGPLNKYSLSWSLNPDVARVFPYKRHCRQKVKLLMTAKILRKYVTALKLTC